MNPWLERFWRDVHASLVVYAADQLSGRLPSDLAASVDERRVSDLEEESPRAYVPDVAITESWDNPVAPANPARGAGGTAVEALKTVLVAWRKHPLESPRRLPLHPRCRGLYVYREGRLIRTSYSSSGIRVSPRGKIGSPHRHLKWE
jgi:hypothetical protein